MLWGIEGHLGPGHAEILGGLLPLLQDWTPTYYQTCGAHLSKLWQAAVVIVIRIAHEQNVGYICAARVLNPPWTRNAMAFVVQLLRACYM